MSVLHLSPNCEVIRTSVKKLIWYFPTCEQLQIKLEIPRTQTAFRLSKTVLAAKELLPVAALFVGFQTCIAEERSLFLLVKRIDVAPRTFGLDALAFALP